MNFILIHGIYGYPEENWFPWLKNELEKEGFEIDIPKFPTPLDQTLESWLRILGKYEDKINSETVLIGHSLGGCFILNYLEQTNKRVEAAYIVAGFHINPNPPYDKLTKTFTDKKLDFEKIKKNCEKFFVIASDNDPYIPLKTTKELAENLKVKPIIVKGGKHLNSDAGYDKFHLILDSIKKAKF